MDLAELREKVAEANRILVGGGILTSNYGHLSARLPGTDRVVILGHLHEYRKVYADATAEDTSLIDLDGNRLEGLYPPSERFLHTEIYRARPEVMSVIHGHPFHSTAMAIAGVAIRPVHILGVPFAPEVPVSDIAELVHTPEMGARIARTLGANWAVLLRCHGNAVCGRGIEEAISHAFALERTAQLQMAALQLSGKAYEVPEEQREHGLVRGFEAEYPLEEWNFWRTKAGRPVPLPPGW